MGDIVGTVTGTLTVTGFTLVNGALAAVGDLTVTDAARDVGRHDHAGRLDVTAQSGPGNLLGNLLCTVTRLLDGNASLNAIQNLLDALTRAISRL